MMQLLKELTELFVLSRATKIACRISAKCQPVFVESPDFAQLETLPNSLPKRTGNVFRTSNGRGGIAVTAVQYSLEITRRF